MIVFFLNLWTLAVVATISESFYQPEPLSEFEQRELKSMEMKISNMIPESFYNYHLMCSSSRARVNIKTMLIHNTVPSKFHDIILNTLHGSHNRVNMCPKWTTANIHTQPEAGSMKSIVLDERTPVGKVIYLLSAIDPERKPLFYFMRKAETEPIINENLFQVKTIKIGANWLDSTKI